MPGFEKRERPAWDEYFMEIAKAVSKRASCYKREEGAVIVRNKQIVSTGYNGAPKKVQNCFEKGYCMRNEKNIPSGERLELCLAAHAEQNAIAQAACSGIAIEGATIYCTSQPCVLCAKVIINSGIREVVFGRSQKERNKNSPNQDKPLPESDVLAAQLLEEAGIRARQYGKEE